MLASSLNGYVNARLLADSQAKTRKTIHLNLSDYFQICIYFDSKKKKNVYPDRLSERGVKSAGQDILCIF